MDAGMIEALRRAGEGAAALPAPLVRAGRAMLGWSRFDLARAAGVSVSSLLRIETGDAGRTPAAAAETHAAAARVRAALEAAGLGFAHGGRGGLRLRMGGDGAEPEDG